MKTYILKLTDIARQDLDDLYAEGFTVWGEVQADTYYDGLLDRFDVICDNPFLYQAVDDVREGYRRSVYRKHSIYYVIDGDIVEIRAVAKRQDVAGRP